MPEYDEVEIQVAEALYNGYCESTDYKSLATGANLPQWEDLPETIKVAWCAAAVAGIDFLASLY